MTWTQNPDPYRPKGPAPAQLTCISHQFGSWFSCIAGFREILRFAQNDNLKQCVILRGGLCPEESLCRLEEEDLFLADVIAACEKCATNAIQENRGPRQHLQVIAATFEVQGSELP